MGLAGHHHKVTSGEGAGLNMKYIEQGFQKNYLENRANLIYTKNFFFAFDN